MKNSYKLAEAEQEVMKVLWENNGKLSTGDLLDQMKKKGKNWKRQTLNTLLARLEEKGLVKRPRAFVEASMTEQELKQLQAKAILDHFYGGKLKNFCAALIGDSRLNAKEAASLNAMIDELQKKQKGKDTK